MVQKGEHPDSCLSCLNEGGVPLGKGRCRGLLAVIFISVSKYYIIRVAYLFRTTSTYQQLCKLSFDQVSMFTMYSVQLKCYFSYLKNPLQKQIINLNGSKLFLQIY